MAEQINTCYICNGLNLVNGHYGQLICNTCYHLIKRIRTQAKKSGQELSRDEFLTKAITRRAELKEKGKWSRNDARHMPNIRIGILK